MRKTKKASVDLTQKAKTIFGDIVESVFICLPWYDGDNKSSLMRNYQIEESKTTSENNEMAIDGLTIEIQFTNGKAVEIHSSEWCSITTSHKRTLVV